MELVELVGLEASVGSTGSGRVGSITYPGLSDPSARFASDLRRFERRYVEQWLSAPATLPSLGPVFSVAEQRRRETEMERGIDRLEALLRAVPALPQRRPAWFKTVQGAIEGLAVDGWAMDPRHSRLVFNDPCFDTTTAFARRARALDPDVEVSDLTQAWRNLWVMNFFQMLLGQAPSLTPSIFAYSMLYPYTDNPLDDQETSGGVKRELSRRLKARLKGLRVEPFDDHQTIVFELVAEIEAQFPRSKHPEVYLSLLAIHDAQTAALIQQSAGVVDVPEILRLSVAKGGASVLADGYLVHGGRLSREQADFFFGYGVLLQLCDDLQDAGEDAKAGHQTLFSQPLLRGGAPELDTQVCRLTHFLERVLRGCGAFPACRRQPLRQLVHDNCLRLIVQAVGSQPEIFSPDFYDFVARRSPVSFAYVRSLGERLEPRGAELKAYLHRTQGIRSLFDLVG